MEEGTVEIKIDFMGNPFIVDACDTDGGAKTQSTKDFLSDEVMNIGLEDTVGNLKDDGIYKVTTTGGWDYEHVEYDYDIHFTLISES